MGGCYIAPIDVILDQHNVAVPDVIFVSRERLAILGEKNVQGAPDLVVEVLSPGTSHRDLGVKMRIYARFGGPYYWIMDPRSVLSRRGRERGLALTTSWRCSRLAC